MTLPPRSSTLGPPPLTELTDEQPIVVHGPVQGSVGIERPGDEARLQLVAPVAEAPAPVEAHEPETIAPEREHAPHERVLPKTQERALSLDALRGLFLVAMTLGFTIHGRFFADWMYHRQFPPPGQFVNVAGLTWRDLAYAAFIFTMAAALPITLSRRIDRGQTEISIFVAIVRRFLLLFLFALLIGHSNTYYTGYTQPARALALLGFALMFIVFVRRPEGVGESRFRLLNRVGWVAAIAFLFLSPLVYESTFAPDRRDDIIAGLAFAALGGSIVWYLTRENLLARLGVLAACVALYLGSRSGGWVQDWWWSSPLPWLIRPSDLTLLTVVIPGTIAGDLLLRWIRRAPGDAAPARWGTLRLATLSFVCAAMTPLAVVGLYNRQVLITTQLIAGLCIAGVFLTRGPRSESENLVRLTFFWASAWLLIGLFLEPAEGGIRKVPETLSYYFTVTGLTMMLLTSLIIVVDVLKKRTWARPLIDVGHNPMMAYVMYTVFLNSVLELIPAMRPVLRGSPGEAMLRSLLIVVAVVLIVQAFTRRRIYWRT